MKIRNFLKKFFLLGIFFAGVLVFDGNNFVASADCYCYCSTPTHFLDSNSSISDNAACRSYCDTKGFKLYSTDGSISGSSEADGIPGSTGSSCANTTMCCLSSDGGACTKCPSTTNTSGGATRVLCSDQRCSSVLLEGSDPDGDGRLGSTSEGVPGGITSGTGSTGSTGSTGPGQMGQTTFVNPLGYDSVEGFLLNFLTVLQRIIVVLSMIFIVVGAIMYITSAGGGMVESAKKTITAALIGLTLGIAAPSFLKEISLILGWTGDTGPVSAALTLSQIAINVLNFLLGAVGVLAIIMLVIGGSMYLISAGDEDKIDTGKKIVKNSIIGIILAFSAMILVKQVANFFITG